MHMDYTSCISLVRIGSDILLLIIDNMESAFLSNRSKRNWRRSRLRYSSFTMLPSESSYGPKTASTQECTLGRHPISSWTRYTIPQRDTVAGEATRRSCTSKSILICARSFIRYPFARQSIMLSSNTVFMFSIHRASTGPSNTTH